MAVACFIPKWPTCFCVCVCIANAPNIYPRFDPSRTPCTHQSEDPFTRHRKGGPIVEVDIVGEGLYEGAVWRAEISLPVSFPFMPPEIWVRGAVCECRVLFFYFF